MTAAIKMLVVLLSYLFCYRAMAQTPATDESTSLLVNNSSTALQYGVLGKDPLGGDQSNKCVSFHNISYEVSQRSCFKKQPPKIILDNVRYCANPCVYVVINLIPTFKCTPVVVL